MASVTIVVPCYNEAARLDRDEFLAWAKRGAMRFLFVDDGSKDGTAALLREMQDEAKTHISVLELGTNRGKAEAVRLGLRHALQGGATVVGYLDADLATPIAELQDMSAEMERRGAAVLLGSRVALLGHRIQRHWYRHYPARVFATLASWVLGLPVYDTQCGAKLFARSSLLESALEDPFRSKWAFDIELLGRLLTGTPGQAPIGAEAMYEYPLHRWTDIPDSKLGWGGMLATTAGLAGVWLDLRRRRQRARRVPAPARGPAPGASGGPRG